MDHLKNDKTGHAVARGRHEDSERRRICTNEFLASIC